MRKRPIVEDFKYIPTYGTFNMKEKTNFITGLGMDIEDTIRIRSIDVWNSNIDSLEGMKESSILSMEISKNQSDIDKQTLTKWVLTLNAKELLREYLYEHIYTLNSDSAFYPITPKYAIDKRPSNTVYSYIDQNLLSRYGVKQLVMWTKYYPLSDGQTPGANPIQLLKNTPVFSQLGKPTGNGDKEIDSKAENTAIKSYVDGTLEVNYTQTKSAQYYTFLYYYDLIFYRL